MVSIYIRFKKRKDTATYSTDKKDAYKNTAE